MEICSYFNGAQAVFFKGEIVFSEPYAHGGNERRELYRLPNGHYLLGTRYRDKGDLLTDIRVSEKRPKGF
jgi:hypothetical protein